MPGFVRAEGAGTGLLACVDAVVHPKVVPVVELLTTTGAAVLHERRNWALHRNGVDYFIERRHVLG